MKVLVVCLGNICRSPAGEAILRRLAKEARLALEVDSCGLGDWHAGSAPDLRMKQAAEARGYLLNGVAKSFKPQFFDQFDLILAADQSVLVELQSRARNSADFQKLQLLAEVPDPYHGTIDDFYRALEILENACQEWIRNVSVRLRQS